MLYCVFFGFLECFIGILIEQYVGKLFFWLVLCQVVVVVIVIDVNDYCCEVVEKLKVVGIQVEVDLCNEKINYKVREYLLVKVLVILVCGMKEVEEKIVLICCFGEK